MITIAIFNCENKNNRERYDYFFSFFPDIDKENKKVFNGFEVLEKQRCGNGNFFILIHISALHEKYETYEKAIKQMDDWDSSWWKNAGFLFYGGTGGADLAQKLKESKPNASSKHIQILEAPFTLQPDGDQSRAIKELAEFIENDEWENFDKYPLNNKHEPDLENLILSLGNISASIQYWLSIWDWQNNSAWQEVKQKLNSLQDFNQRKNAWEKTRPDRLFKTKDKADFWFSACETKIKEIYFDLFPVPEQDKEKQSLLSDALFWGYPAKAKWRFADCKPFLHNRDSLNDALVVAENLNTDEWRPPSLSSSYNGGGCLRLLFEAIYWGLNQNEPEEKFNRITARSYQEDLLNLNKETIKFFICKAGEIQCDENKNQDMAALFEGKNTKYEDMRKRIEWLFKTARNEYLTILETIEFKKKSKNLKTSGIL